MSDVQIGRRGRPRRLGGPIAAASAGLVVCGLLAGCTASSSSWGPAPSPSRVSVPASAAPSGAERVSGGPSGSYVAPAGIHTIKHVIIVMQENRSFDSYFGTYPGADGIPMSNPRPLRVA